MSRIVRNLSIVLRTEQIIARRRMEVLRRQTGLILAAALLGLIGLVTLNIAAFLGLETRISATGAALVVALVNLALAAILVLVAGRLNADAEVQPVTELRDLALTEIEAEVEGAAEEARAVAADLRRMARDPLGSALPALAGPLMSLLLNTLKRDTPPAETPPRD